MSTSEKPWGLLAEFGSAEALLDAATRARAAGYARAEAYSPFPIEGLAEALAFTPSRVGAATLMGAAAGGLGAYLLQWFSATIDYPIVVGGRPLHSWPMFVPVTFEMTILGGALAAVAALPRRQPPAASAPSALRRARFRARVAATLLPLPAQR